MPLITDPKVQIHIIGNGVGDTIHFNGNISLPADFDLNGMPVSIFIAGVQSQFVLGPDGTGQMKRVQISGDLSMTFAGDTANFDVRLFGDLTSRLGVYGFYPFGLNHVLRYVPVRIHLGTQAIATVLTVYYTYANGQGNAEN